LARPGANTTGLASQFEELITKQLQLLKEITSDKQSSKRQGGTDS
jgi:hypothetical protein